MTKPLLLLLIALSLLGCESSGHHVEVTDNWLQPLSTQGIHEVRRGETLYSVAWRYGKDYRELAANNHIPAPYKVVVGQKIHLVSNQAPLSKPVTQPENPKAPITLAQKTPYKATSSRVEVIDLTAAQGSIVRPKETQQSRPSPTEKSAPLPSSIEKSAPVSPLPPPSVEKSAPASPRLKSTPSTIVKQEPIPSTPLPTSGKMSAWLWPVNGKLIGTYGTKGGKGINIAARLGTPVKATGAGRVVYCGSGLRGYGELVILKHNDEFLSAYAHNHKLLVREGDKIKAGQVIAEMGDSEAKQVMLHFEIRRAGKPVDPLQFLPRM